MTRAMNLDALEAQAMDANGWKECDQVEVFFGSHPFQQKNVGLLAFVTYMLRSFLGNIKHMSRIG